VKIDYAAGSDDALRGPRPPDAMLEVDFAQRHSLHGGSFVLPARAPARTPQVSRILYVFYGLLALLVIIAPFGIADTLRSTSAPGNSGCAPSGAHATRSARSSASAMGKMATKLPPGQVARAVLADPASLLPRIAS
jgi:hypothetical protein